MKSSRWIVQGRPGYFGKRRAEIEAELTQKWGAGGWKLGWRVHHEVVALPQALMVYEDAYYEHFKRHPVLLEELVTEASDVYDDAPSNVHSGLDYSVQETSLNHWHDIAIRRAVMRLGRVFAGSELLQIRHTLGSHRLSTLLSPGEIPFHHPDWIVRPELTKYWWRPGSLESWYQSNKYLCVLESALHS